MYGARRDSTYGKVRVRRGKRTDLEHASKLGLYLVDSGGLECYLAWKEQLSFRRIERAAA